MIYIQNPTAKGSDIVDFVVGEPGNSRKYTLEKGKTKGFKDKIALEIIHIFGVEDGRIKVDGEYKEVTEGFLRIKSPKKSDENQYEKEEGEQIVAPAEIARLQDQGKKPSMRPRMPKSKLTPKTYEDLDYKREGIAKGNRGSNQIPSEAASNFYGPGLEKDQSVK